MKYLIAAALMLSGCNLIGERWNYREVLCTDGSGLGAVEGTLAMDTVTNQHYLRYRNERGVPQNINITYDREWVCADNHIIKESNDVSETY